LPLPGSASADYDPDQIARTADKTLLNRWGTPEDVTEAVLFFIRAPYVTGEVLAVDGGERFGHRKYEIG
jgi:NAD(P)-dependent dehydrogenase (short-subunit alcohol dehydrogenase family)